MMRPAELPNQLCQGSKATCTSGRLRSPDHGKSTKQTELSLLLQHSHRLLAKKAGAKKKKVSSWARIM